MNTNTHDWTHTHSITCTYCHGPTGPHDLTEITGWTEPRTQGGPNHIIDRAPTGRRAHRLCIEIARRSHEQLDLLTPPDPQAHTPPQ